MGIGRLRGNDFEKEKHINFATHETNQLVLLEIFINWHLDFLLTFTAY